MLQRITRMRGLVPLLANRVHSPALRVYSSNPSNNGTSNEVYNNRTKITAQLWKNRPEQPEGSIAPHIIEKVPRESWVEVYYPFSSDVELREKYINFYGHLRMGIILEDLDACAGNISHLHADDNNPETRPLTIVTASCDRIDLLNKLYADRDMRTKGCVTWVGRSSMGITITVEALNSNPESKSDKTSTVTPEEYADASQQLENVISKSAHSADRRRFKELVLLNAESQSTVSKVTTTVNADATYAEQQKQQQSSTEGTTKAEQSGKWEPLIVAEFTMVALDAQTGRSTEINRLKPTTEEEKKLFALGEESNKQRRQFAKQSLTMQPPTAEEQRTIHNLFMETQHLQKLPDTLSSSIFVPSSTKAQQSEQSFHFSDKYAYIHETGLQSVTLCQPQERNRHGKIFGGYLMRKGFELAWNTSAMYSQSLPRFLALDQVTFHKPVEIGSILILNSEVVCTDGPNIMVKVVAEVVNPAKGTRDISNTFHFTFKCAKDVQLKKVIPESYEDAMKYLDAMRRLARGKQTASWSNTPNNG